jgi:hypothetical protein
MNKLCKKLNIFILLALISIVAVNFLIVPENIFANPDNIITVSPSQINVEAGEDFDVEIVLTTDTDTNSVGFILTWTGSGRISFIDATEGSFYSEQ